MKNADDSYFLPVPISKSIATKLFLSISLFAIAAVGVTNFFLMFIPAESMALALIVFVVVPAILISALFSRYISKPIRDITDGLQKISKGDFHFQISTNRKDELGHLISLFNETLKKMEEVRKRNEEVSGIKSTFVTVTAHQLRTPATGIKWVMGILKDSPNLSPEEKGMVDQSAEAINQINAIVDDFLNLAKIEGEDFNYNFKKTSLFSLTDKAVKLVKLRAEEHHVSIISDVRADNDVEIVADSERLMDVFSALIDNAVSYSKENGKVEIGLTIDKESILVSVTDQGIGIPEADQPKIFFQFYRAANAISHRPNGSGLGLYICRSIVEHHHGEIWFKSKKGEGTTFYVRLPLQRDLAPTTAKIESALESL